MPGSVVLFNRDLRVHDHPALAEAARRGPVVPLFVVDDALLATGFAVPNRAAFLVDCLTDLRDGLRQRGADLVVRRGDPVAEALRLAGHVGADSIHVSADVTAFARAREHRLAAACAAARVEFGAHPGVMVVPADALHTGGGEHYKVFTPYWRAWCEHPRRAVEEAPRRIELPSGIDPGPLPTPDDLTEGDPSPELARGGEDRGRELLTAWVTGAMADYEDGHDDLAGDRTSGLSPHLHFGTISPLEVVTTADRRPGGDGFARQLCWRDFHHQSTYAFPAIGHEDLRGRGRRWRDDPQALAAWREGRTGLPIIDAGLRQLLRTGWMHNRTRMLVASFLTKHLGIDWRPGAAHFARWLVDGDVANNAANWQWVAGTGSDTRPNRIFNPIRQAHRFDPAGDYVRRWVPELAGIAGGAVHEPWRLAGTFEGAGIDYPAPIVDHEVAAAEFRAGPQGG